MTTTKKPKPMGFAGMDPDAQRRIASMGGRAAHQKGTAHQFTSEEAAAAGRRRHELIRQRKEAAGKTLPP